MHRGGRRIPRHPAHRLAQRRGGIFGAVLRQALGDADRHVDLGFVEARGRGKFKRGVPRQVQAGVIGTPVPDLRPRMDREFSAFDQTHCAVTASRTLQRGAVEHERRNEARETLNANAAELEPRFIVSLFESGDQQDRVMEGRESCPTLRGAGQPGG